MCEAPFKMFFFNDYSGVGFFRLSKRIISISKCYQSLVFLAGEFEQMDQKLEAKVYQTLQLQVA